jgi:hypothetical protein
MTMFDTYADLLWEENIVHSLKSTVEVVLQKRAYKSFQEF